MPAILATCVDACAFVAGLYGAPLSVLYMCLLRVVHSGLQLRREGAVLDGGGRDGGGPGLRELRQAG